MVFEKNVISNTKVTLLSFFFICLFIYLILVTCHSYLQWFLLLILILLALFIFFIRKKILIQQVEENLFTIDVSNIFFYSNNSQGFPLRNVYCIYLCRRSGSKSLSSSKTGSGQMVRSAVNILQIIDAKDDVIFETELWDDKESYNVAYWLQSFLKVEIHDYMGRELEVISFES